MVGIGQAYRDYGPPFVPMLLAVSFGRRLFGFAASVFRRLPRTGNDALDSFFGMFRMEPETIAAVRHGILIGPVAPEIEERRAITAPTLIIGHANDFIHPFSDAENLAQQVPNARLVQARSMFELRVEPERLTREIARFLDEAYGKQEPAQRLPDSTAFAGSGWEGGPQSPSALPVPRELSR